MQIPPSAYFILWRQVLHMFLHLKDYNIDPIEIRRLTIRGMDRNSQFYDAPERVRLYCSPVLREMYRGQSDTRECAELQVNEPSAAV
jgi:hypothetical protein